MIRKYFDCPPGERLRRIGVFALIGGVVYVPGVVTLVMLLTGNA